MAKSSYISWTFCESVEYFTTKHSSSKCIKIPAENSYSLLQKCNLTYQICSVCHLIFPKSYRPLVSKQTREEMLRMESLFSTKISLDTSASSLFMMSRKHITINHIDWRLLFDYYSHFLKYKRVQCTDISLAFSWVGH